MSRRTVWRRPFGVSRAGRSVPSGASSWSPPDTLITTPWPLKTWTWTTTPASPWVGLASRRTYSESSPSSNMQVGAAGVALARDTRTGLGRESAVLIIRHVIGRGCHMWVIEPSPANRVANVKQPLAAARPEGHSSPQPGFRCMQRAEMTRSERIAGPTGRGCSVLPMRSTSGSRCATAGASALVARRPHRCRKVRGNGRWTSRPLARCLRR